MHFPAGFQPTSQGQLPFPPVQLPIAAPLPMPQGPAHAAAVPAAAAIPGFANVVPLGRYVPYNGPTFNYRPGVTTAIDVRTHWLKVHTHARLSGRLPQITETLMMSFDSTPELNAFAVELGRNIDVAAPDADPALTAAALKVRFLNRFAPELQTREQMV